MPSAPRRPPTLPLVVLLSAAAVTAGCRGDGGGRSEIVRAPVGLRAVGQDRATARRETAEAVRAAARGDLTEAERHLRAALAADPAYGPARNNLGEIHFSRGDLYRAAVEFEYAARLAPDRPEPRNNLGLTLESAGRIDEAVDRYAEAHALAPHDPQVAANLARARFRRGDRGPELRRLLEQVSGDARPEWATWARRQLATVGPSQPDSPDPSASGVGAAD